MSSLQGSRSKYTHLDGPSKVGECTEVLIQAKPADACASQRAILNDEPTVVEANKVGITTDSEIAMYISNLQSILQIRASVFQILAKYI